jgi:tetratricopeptide (TPR) repeat protein
MGYGVKTDYSTGRELDLDKTYKNIIKPAVEDVGLECLRADEIRHSGIIDVPMYRYLISADIVIADLSTYNTNAFYELGVRHALRPHTTIAIAEQELKYPFDVNHTVIRQYEHLGKDIGYSEVIRFRQELQKCISEILNEPNIDSPVYTYLNNLHPPIWSDDTISQQENGKESLSLIIEQAKYAMDKEKNFSKARSLFELAHSIDKRNAYILQKLVLTTYKAKQPNHVDSLYNALKILEVLKPGISMDPETLGLAGAIHKRLWEELKEIHNLTKAIYYYERGFYIKKDYYNGINLGFLLNLSGSLSTNKNDRIADYVLAKRVRMQVVEICKTLMKNNFDNRSDKYWIVASLEEAYFGLGNLEKYQKYKNMAKELSDTAWELETTENQINKLKNLLEVWPI